MTNERMRSSVRGRPGPRRLLLSYFFRDELAVPAQDRIGSHHRAQLAEQLAAEYATLDREATALRVRESDALRSEVLAQHTVFRFQVVDHLLLLAVDPAGERRQHHVPASHEAYDNPPISIQSTATMARQRSKIAADSRRPSFRPGRDHLLLLAMDPAGECRQHHVPASHEAYDNPPISIQSAATVARQRSEIAADSRRPSFRTGRGHLASGLSPSFSANASAVFLAWSSFGTTIPGRTPPTPSSRF